MPLLSSLAGGALADLVDVGHGESVVSGAAVQGLGEHQQDVGVAEHRGVLRLGQVLVSTVDVGAGVGLQVGEFDLPVSGEVHRIVLGHVDDGVAAQPGIGEVLGESIFGNDGHIAAVGRRRRSGSTGWASRS